MRMIIRQIGIELLVIDVGASNRSNYVMDRMMHAVNGPQQSPSADGMWRCLIGLA